MTNDPHQTSDSATWPESARAMRDANWRVRQQAVNRLKEETAEETVLYLLYILRDVHRDLSQVNGAIQILAQTPADVVPNLLDLLQSPDADVRSYSALTLGERGDPRAIEGLLTALADENSNVRTHVIEALGKLRAGAAVDDLIRCVETRDFSQSFPALDALVPIGDERIAERLIPLLGDSLFKAAAVEALGELGNEHSIRPIMALFADPDVDSKTVIRALVRLDQRQQTRYGKSLIRDEVRRLASSETIASLTAAAAGARGTEVATIATALIWFAGDETDAALVNLLKRWPGNETLIEILANPSPQIVLRLNAAFELGDAEVRRAILQVLARSTDEAAIPTLLQAIETEEDDELVARAMAAVTAFGDRRLEVLAMNRLGHSSPTIRNAAVNAVGTLHPAETSPRIMSLLEDSSPLMRESAVKLAGMRGDCHDLIIASCNDSDERVRRAAIEQLVNRTDTRSFECVTHALRTDTAPVRATVAAALAKYEQKTGVAKLLADSLRDPDVWVRYFSIRSLSALDHSSAIKDELLALAFYDPATQVRIAAIEALGTCGPELFSKLAELASSADSELRAAAIAALPATHHPDAYSLLVHLVASKESETTKQAIQALALFRDERGVLALRDWVVGRVSPHWMAAVDALAGMRIEQATEVLIEAAAWPQRRESCIDALVRLGDQAVPALARSLRTSGLDIRRAIVEALVRIRTPQAIGVLETALDDSAPAVHYSALTALGFIGHIDRTMDAR